MHIDQIPCQERQQCTTKLQWLNLLVYIYVSLRLNMQIIQAAINVVLDFTTFTAI